MLTRIHVNQHNIKANAKYMEEGMKHLPVITVKDYKQNRKGHEAIIRKNGEEVARVIYSPNKPLKCGARVWIETENKVEVRDALGT